MQIDEYCDLAKAQAGFRSDRDLAKSLGLNPTAVSFYRTKKAWPSEETMVKLAEMAGLDPERAVMELGAWRTSGRVRAIYVRMAEKIAKTAAAIVIALVAGHLYPTDAQARTALERPAVAQDAVYYGKYCLRLRDAGSFSGSQTHKGPRIAALFFGFGIVIRSGSSGNPMPTRPASDPGGKRLGFPRIACWLVRLRQPCGCR